MNVLLWVSIGVAIWYYFWATAQREATRVLGIWIGLYADRAPTNDELKKCLQVLKDTQK